MSFKAKITDYEKLETLLDENSQFHLLYMTQPDCGVCDVVRPKVEEMLGRHKEIDGYYIDLKDDPRIGGQFSVFTVPALLLYRDRRELFREARYIVLDVIEPQLERILDNFSPSAPPREN